MINYDSQLDELLARGGSFDLTGTNALTTKQFSMFNASDGAVIAVIKGVPVKSTVSTYAAITAAEVDLSAKLVTLLATGLMAGVPYRVDGYVITNIQLTSGSLHLYLTNKQIVA